MSFATAIPPYWRIIDVRFYVSVVEEFSGIDVDDMLQLRKKKQFFDMLLRMCLSWDSHRNLLSTMKRSRRCSVTFSIFWPPSDSLNDKPESWCFCRVVIIIDFVFTGLLSMWLTLHHTEIQSRQRCNVFWICTPLFPVVWNVVSSASIWHSAEFDGVCRGRSLI